jgi:hypothetical protein
MELVKLMLYDIVCKLYFNFLAFRINLPVETRIYIENKIVANTIF